MRRDTLELRKSLGQVAARQGGYFTASQALEAGYSYQSQRYHTGRGEWTKVDRGIYRLADWPEPDRGDLIRWSLWSRGRGVVSHETALAVHDLGDVMPARVHLTVPANFRSSAPGVILHRGDIASRDIEGGEGYSVTKPERSILDVARAGIEVDQMATVIGDALDRGVTTATSLRARSDEFGPQAALTIERALREIGL